MNKSTYRKTIDVQKHGNQFTINAVQGETAARQLILNVVDGGKPFDFGVNNVAAIIYGTKPDGTTFYNDCTISGNVVTYAITSQNVAVAGDVKAKLQITAPSGAQSPTHVLYSPEFTIYVQENADYSQAVPSADEQNAFETAMNAASHIDISATKNTKLGVSTVTVTNRLNEQQTVTLKDGSIIYFTTHSPSLTSNNRYKLELTYLPNAKAKDMVIAGNNYIYFVTEIISDKIYFDDRLYIKGNKGDTGSTGAKGDKGDKGDTGDRGVRGRGLYTATSEPIEYSTQPSLYTHTLRETYCPVATTGDTVRYESFLYQVVEHINNELHLKNKQSIRGATGATGETGATGADGQDGFSPIVTAERTQADDGVVITITDKTGTTSAEVYDGEGTTYTAGQNISISAQNEISAILNPELYNFVDALPQSNINTNSYYLTVNSKLFPDASSIHANNRAVIVTYTEANGWRLMSVKTDVSPQILYGEELYLWGGSLAPKSLPHTIYEVKSNYTWGKMSGYEDGDITSDGWEALMSMDTPDVPTNVQFTEYIKLCIGSYGRIQGITNKANISGVPTDSSKINPYLWLANKYVNSAWEAVGICDIEPLINKIAHRYSSTEKIVGYWVNGKPIYEKTVAFTLDNSGVWYSNAEAGGEVFPNVAQCLDIKGFANLNDTALGEFDGTVMINSDLRTAGTAHNQHCLIKSYFIYDSDPDAYGLYIEGVSGTHSSVEFAFGGATGYVTLQYTKTTD